MLLSIYVCAQDNEQTIVYASGSGISLEVLKHEMTPIASFFADKGRPLKIIQAGSIKEFLDWADDKKFDINFVGPEMAYLLSTYYNYKPLLQTKAPNRFVVVTRRRGASIRSEGVTLILQKNDLLARYVAEHSLSFKDLEYHSTIENVLISLLKTPKRIALMEANDILLLPNDLRKKLHWRELESYPPYVVMCRESSSVSCDTIKNWLLELHINWNDPGGTYTYMNSLTLKPCCNFSEFIAPEIQRYIDNILLDDYGVDLPQNKNMVKK